MCADQTWRCILQDLCHLMKVNKKSGSPRNEENKISSNKLNDVLEEEDEGQHNKSPNSKSEELKDNTEKPCTNAVVENKMNGIEEWKKGKIMSIQPKSTGKYSPWLNIKPETEN